MHVDIDGLDTLLSEMSTCVEGYDKKAKSFLNKEGNGLKSSVKGEIDARTERHTGNLYNAVTRQKPYKYYKENAGKAKDSVKVFGKRGKASANTMSIKKQMEGQSNVKGHHTHLIEYGHKKVLWGRRTNGYVMGRLPYSGGLDAYSGTFENDCEAFVKDVLGTLDD